MTKQVVKRDGTVVDYNPERIERVIVLSGNQSEKPVEPELVKQIVGQITGLPKKTLTVEEIQDLVVKKLMASHRKDVAMLYQSYRAIKTDLRNKEAALTKQIGEIVDASNESVLSENANKDAKTISVQRDLLAGVSSKEYYLNNVLPKHIAESHKKGEIHIHDLDYLLFRETNCELVNIEAMLAGGCNIGNAKMTEPNSVEVAVGHIVQIIASVTSHTYGGCTIPYIDRALVPYIKKTFKKHFEKGLRYIYQKSEAEVVEFCENNEIDHSNTELEHLYVRAYEYAENLTTESVKQAIQGLEYEVNSLSTVNGQTPFVTIGIGAEVSWEGKLVQEHVFKTRMNGFGAKKETAIFPKIVFAMAEGLNFSETDPNWDIALLAFECMTKSIYPDILFVTPEQVANGTIVYPMGK